MKLSTGKSLLAGALIALAASGAMPASAGGLQTVDVRQVGALQRSGTLLLDVREPDEYAQAHAAGSVLIPLGQLPQRLQEIDGHKHQPIALICRSGNRSGHALEVLERAGYSGAVNVEGGMLAWQKAGLPIVTGAAKSPD